LSYFIKDDPSPDEKPFVGVLSDEPLFWGNFFFIYWANGLAIICFFIFIAMATTLLCSV
jgi:hypothetical protein